MKLTDAKSEHLERRALINAGRDLGRAERDLAYAADQLERTERAGWCSDVDGLMRRCAALREAIAGEAGQ